MTAAKYRNVFFDVDSTLVTIEGIDVLARGDSSIAKLTEAAMNGEIPVDEVARLIEETSGRREAGIVDQELHWSERSGPLRHR